MEAKAVITGDIINFTKLSPAKRQKVIQDMEQLLHSWVGKKANAEVFRGDSYQALFNQVTEAIKRSIQLLCWFKKHPETTAKNQLGTRISIGIGEIAYQGKSVLNSDGEAFHLSGRNFDKMKPGEFVSIQTNDSHKNAAIEIILNFVNKYISHWTQAQSEVIFLVLEGKTQQEIAEQLSLSQPSINSRLKSAGWKEIEPAIEYIASLVK